MTTFFGRASAGLAIRLLAAAAIGLAALGCASAAAQVRGTAIKLIVPAGAGGPLDLVARYLAVPLQNILQQPVIVDNRPGAGTTLGARLAASARPDGQTMLIGNVSTFAIAPATMKAPGYDPIRSFTPLLQVSDTNLVMVAQPGFPPDNVPEFVAYAKANPGKIAFGSGGVGGSAHLVGELIKARAKLDMVHVPYRSGSEISNAVLSGQVQIAFTDISASLPHIREGKLKVLAVTGLVRSPEFPNVKTMAEAGYPDVVLRNWFGIVLPPDAPPAVVRRLESAVNEVLVSNEFAAAIARMGGRATPGKSEDFAALIATEYQRWSEVAKTAGVSLD